MLKIIEKQPTEENPYIVDNYPYGFRLKTKIRYWVETTKRGQRFISQTLNPKTQKWNKPKKSVYSNIILIGLNEKGYITYTNLNLYSKEEAENFYNNYNKFFSEYQHKEYKAITGMLKVYDKVEYKVSVRRFRHKVTKEITENIPLMEINQYEEINENNQVVNQEEEQKQQKDLNRRLNYLAVESAVKEGVTEKEALSSFKRS